MTLNKQRCTCHSYNQQEGETPSVILTVPENIRLYTDGRKTVCIDACIADAVKAMWDAGLPTINSCCGHNKAHPEIVIPEGFDPYHYLEALGAIDNRAWVVSRWERVQYTADQSVAELEAREVTLPAAWWVKQGSQSFLAYEEQLLCDALTAAGIRIKGDK